MKKVPFGTIKGPAGTVEIASTVSLPPGEDARVVNEGTPESAVLRFEIPRGEKGDPGDRSTHRYVHTGVAWFEAGAAAPDTYQAVDGLGRDSGLLPGNTGYERQTMGVPAVPAVQSRMRRCVVADDGTRVVYYLDADDSNLVAGEWDGGVQTGWVRVVEGALDPVAPAYGEDGAPSAALREHVPAWSGAVEYSSGERVVYDGLLWDSLCDGNLNVEPAPGTASADLTGGDGQVMVEIPAFYYRMDYSAGLSRHAWEIVFDADRYRLHPDLTTASALSPGISVNGRGFDLHPTFTKAGHRRHARYVSAFGVSATDTGNNASGVLRSIGNGSTLNSTRISGDNFQRKARNRNTGLSDISGVANNVWSMQDYWVRHALILLLVTEYRSLASQETVGYGNSSGAAYNTVAGRSAPMGSSSGAFDDNGARVSGATTSSGVAYRGIEDPWGTAYTWVDGVNLRNGATTTEVWLPDSEAPADYAFSTSSGYSLVAHAMKGRDAWTYPDQLIPGHWYPSTGADDGGSSGSFTTDGWYTNAATDNSWRAVRVGGYAGFGRPAGVGAVFAGSASGNASVSFGAALLL